MVRIKGGQFIRMVRIISAVRNVHIKKMVRIMIARGNVHTNGIENENENAYRAAWVNWTQISAFSVLNAIR